MDWIIQFDHYLFKAINGWHAFWADDFFYVVSTRWVWIPVYLVLIAMLIKSYGVKTGLIYTFAIVLTVVIVDLVSVQLFKEWVQRLRPCHNPALKLNVHLYNNDCGGTYGFVSSHAANFGAWCTLGFLWLHNRVKYIGVLLFLAFLLVAYSRVYLGRHYPLDVWAGGVIGAGMALLVYWSFKKWYKTEP
jgi:undecaprenyl-diphosphatase